MNIHYKYTFTASQTLQTLHRLLPLIVFLSFVQFLSGILTLYVIQPHKAIIIILNSIHLDLSTYLPFPGTFFPSCIIGHLSGIIFLLEKSLVLLLAQIRR